jgi:FAD/FMN-containing dehydrogenase
MLGSDKIWRRGEDGYEEARRGPARNGRIPDRFPEVVVQADDTDDVQEAVRMAAREDLRIAIRSGGHSFSVSAIRDGGMLLDVGRLDEVSVDADGLTAEVGPGRRGNEMCTQLEDVGLFFPGGHCKGVALGGYLLQGGYGWNSRALGLACESVLAVEVVTADGELVHADEDHDPDLYWAARGAGPGFFGVVTKFHLRLYPKPGEFGASNYIFPIEVMDELYTWARQVCPEVDRRVEMQLLLGSDFDVLGVEGPAVLLSSAVFADSEEEARQAIAIERTCPVLDRAIVPMGYGSARLADMYELVMLAYPDGARRAVDNMWTSAPAEQLVPMGRTIADSMPPPPSHLLWLNWGLPVSRPDMAYSVEDEVYLALYGGWTDEADDERYAPWAVSHMRQFEHLSSGIQLADENLGERPARFATDANMARLDAIRAAYDPDGRFHSWLGRL